MAIRRVRAVSGVAIVGGLLIMGGATRWVVATRNPQINITYPAMPAPNAFDVYLKAAGKLVHKHEVGDALSSQPIAGRTTPVTLKEKEALLAENAEALSLLREGLKLPYSESPVRTPETLTPYYSEFRAMARLLRLEGDVRWAKGDKAGAQNSYMDAIQFGQSLAHGGTLISRLVGVACVAIGRQPLWKKLREDSPDAVTAKAGARRMDGLLARHVPYAETIEGEKRLGQGGFTLWFHDDDYMARTLREWSDYNDYERPASTAEKLKVQGMYLRWSKQEIYNNYTGYMDALTAQARLPYAQAKTFPLPKPMDPLNKQLSGSLDAARLKSVESEETQNALLAVSLALRAYQEGNRENAEDENTYPETLAELCPKYLSRIPDDPFAPVAGTPLRYGRTEYHYILYSVGPDGVPDGGNPIIAPEKTERMRYFVHADSKGDVVAGINIY